MSTTDTPDCIVARFERIGQTAVKSAHGQRVLRQLTAELRLTPDHPMVPHRPPQACPTHSEELSGPAC